MSTIRTILAATDFSAPSRHAIRRATMLARHSGAKLEILHVVPAGALEQLQRLFGDQADANLPEVLEGAREQLHQLAQDLCQSLGVSPGLHLTHGSVLEEIPKLADALDASLLVLGARGLGFMHHLLLGSTAERMLRKTLRPLLVVKQLPHADYRRVLVAVDGSDHALRAILLARALCPGADLLLMHVIDDTLEGTLRYARVSEDTIHHFRVQARQEGLELLERQARLAGLGADDYQRLVLTGYPATHILEQEEEKDVELIVIGKRGLSSSEELLLGSTTKHVLAEARGDVLVAR